MFIQENASETIAYGVAGIFACGISFIVKIFLLLLTDDDNYRSCIRRTYVHSIPPSYVIVPLYLGTSQFKRDFS